MRKGLLALVTAVVLSAFAIPAQAIQCVPYARQLSGIDLQGDAWKWWNAAAGRYDRGRTPQNDAVMVFGRQGSMRYGHVSVVNKVVNSRMILVDHANWAPLRSAGRGAITKLVPVIDVSAKNDWTKVRVWYEPSSSFGSKVYRTDGFVYNPSRRTTPTKSALQRIALNRTIQAVSAVEKDMAGLHKDSIAPLESRDAAKPESVKAPIVAKASEPVAVVVPVAVAVVTPSPAPPHAPTVAAAEPSTSAPISVEVNDNLGTAIVIAKTSFGARGSASDFMFN